MAANPQTAAEERGGIPAEVLRKVRLIEISTRRLVNNVLAGSYHSAFKGQGVEVAEVRDYVPGDDVRAIDWNVTARMGHPFVKVFAEERELTVVLAVDVSGSSAFGSGNQLKREVATEIAALLAFSAIRNNDRVGLLLFSDENELFLPPKKGRKHGLQVIRELVSAKARGKGTSVGDALAFLRRILHRRAVIFLLSDFLDGGFERPLRALSKQHDVSCIEVTDHRELEIPRVGLLELEDPETGERVLIDSSSEEFQNQFRIHALKHADQLEGSVRRAGAEYLRIDATVPYERKLVSLFRTRQQRRGR